MSTQIYEEVLVKTREASKLEAWLEANRGGKRGSTWEANLWALAMLAASALHYFLRKILSAQIDTLNASGEDAGAQASLDLMPPQPASARDLHAAVHAFMETQRIEHDDSGRPPKPQPRRVEGEEQPEPDEPAAAVASTLRLAAPDRLLPVELIATWPSADRVAAFRWAEHVAGGGQAPPPEVLARTYMEDLRLGEPADRGTLLAWVGIDIDATAVDWSDELWEEVLGWARAAHRYDRGEHEVQVPPCPAIFLPSRELFGEVKAFVNNSVGEVARPVIVGLYCAEHPGVSLAIDALVARGEMSFSDGDLGPCYVASSSELWTEVAELVAAAEALGRRADVPAEAQQETLRLSLGLDGEEPVALTERMADNIDGILGDGNPEQEHDDEEGPAPKRRGRPRKVAP